MFPLLAAPAIAGGMKLGTKIVVWGLIIAITFVGGLYMGNEWGSRKLSKAIIAQAKEEKKIEIKRDKITAKADKHYIWLKGETKIKTKNLIIRVPEYVKDTCPLSPSLRLFHDYAAEGEIPKGK